MAMEAALGTICPQINEAVKMHYASAGRDDGGAQMKAKAVEIVQLLKDNNLAKTERIAHHRLGPHSVNRWGQGLGGDRHCTINPQPQNTTTPPPSENTKTNHLPRPSYTLRRSDFQFSHSFTFGSQLL